MADQLLGPFMLGTHLASITVAGGNPNSSGAVTWQSAVSIKDVFMRIQPQRTKESQIIAPATSGKINSVTTRSGYRGSLTVLKVSNAAQELDGISITYEYIKIVAVEGVTPGAATWTMRFRVGDHEPAGIDGEGQQLQTLALEPCGWVGEEQVTRSVA